MTRTALEPKPVLPMPIRAKPYRHQIKAFNFVCGRFGLANTTPSQGDERQVMSMSSINASRGCALLMEM